VILLGKTSAPIGRTGQSEAARFYDLIVRREYASSMDPTVIAAAIGVGGTVIVGVVGFSTSIWNTRKTFAHDHEVRLWDKRAAAYEAALTEIMNRSTTRERWLNSSSETWTTENVEEYLASQAKPEWSAAEGRLLAYASERVLGALYATRSAGADLSEAFDRVGQRIAAGKWEMAAGTITWNALGHQVLSMIDLAGTAASESHDRDEELSALIRMELQGRARDRPLAIVPRNAMPDADEFEPDESEYYTSNTDFPS
jgi:hypothetical protein